MQQSSYVLALAMLPALGNLVGGIAAEFLPLSQRTLSLALHLAAGIILAVVGIELIGTAMQASQIWLVALAFVAGGGFAVLLDKAIDWMKERFGKQSSSGPWMIYAGVTIDLFSDGIMIGTGAAIAGALALVLALGQVSADVPEGFATIATFRRKGVPRYRRILLSLSFFIPVLLGAAAGYWAMRDAAEIYKFALLAFTGGVLTITVVEEMMAQAHSEQIEEESGWYPMALAGGFGLFMLLTGYLE